MKFKSKIFNVSMIVCILFASVIYSIVMNSEKVQAANDNVNSIDYQLEKEAIKYVAINDINPETGRLKEGVIYHVGGDNRYLTSNGFVDYSVNQENEGLATVRTNKPSVTILPAYNDRNVLFSNSTILDFDVTHDESKLYIETKRNVLVDTRYEESSHYETKGRLVWKSKVQKIWFARVTIWYLAYETYQEQVIVRTPIQTYQEERSTALTLDLDEDTNIIAKLIGQVVDNKLPELREQSDYYGIPIAISFLSLIVSTARNIFLQLLSIVAEFIPVIDEVKTGYETIYGKDMFTGEKIGLFWQIFSGITLAIGLIAAAFTFGSAMIVTDAIGDGITTTKKMAKIGDNIAELPGQVRATTNALENATDLAKTSDSIYDTGKTIGNINFKQAKLDSGATFSKNPFQRGFIIDEFAGNIKNADNAKEGIIGLGRTAKTYDLLDTSSGTLISVKSLDTGKPTYATKSGFKRTVSEYINKADIKNIGKSYSGTAQGAKNLQKGIDFTQTGLDLYIPKGGLKSWQWEALEEITKTLPDNFVFNIIELS